jgi:hypothetical protein
MECWVSQYSATPFLAFFNGKPCAVARSEQVKARGRRTPETYAVSTLRIPDDRERRDAKLIANGTILRREIPVARASCPARCT